MTAPGWYPDSQSPGLLRWWDGNQWTQHTRSSRVIVSAPIDAPAHVSQPIVASTHQPDGLPAEIARLRSEYEHWKQRVVEVSNLAMLQEVGIYEFRHRLQDVPAYQERLDTLRDLVRDMAKNDRAVRRGTGWAINGSASEGAKMVKDLSKLMLRAYNHEADDAVRTMKPYGLEAAIKRLEKSRETISRLGAALKIEVTDDYHRLRVEELELTADYLVKLAEQKEHERAERERMRDEEQAQREMARETERLQKEQTHYETALAAMRANGDEKGAAKAEAKLVEIGAAIDGVERRKANTRAGWVYIISNVGAFGEGVIKIGLTRREDPRDRVRELGDASVPFLFDEHAMIFSADAVTLEGQLHELFAAQRVNLVNARREFFHVTPRQVREALARFDANMVTFIEEPEALEWRQSVAARAPSLDGPVDSPGGT